MGTLASELVETGDYVQRLRTLKEQGWWLADLTAVDRLLEGAREALPGPQSAGAPSQSSRFSVVTQLLNRERRERRLVHVFAEGEPPTVPSVTPLWPGANAFEREVYDLFGIHFEDHPKLERIMLPDEWEGHPLRKDYGVGKVPVEFVPQPFFQIQGPGQSARGEEAGEELDALGQAAGREPRGSGMARRPGGEHGGEGGR